MRALIFAIAALAGTAHAAPCLTWSTPTQRADGAPLRAEDIAGYKITWVRTRVNSTARLQRTTALLTGNRHWFSATRSYRYVFTIVTVDAKGQESVPSNEVRWGSW